MRWCYRVWHGLLPNGFSSCWSPSPGPERWHNCCAFSLKRRSLQAPCFTASLSVYMMLFLCISTWFKMPFFLIYISLSCEMLLVFLIYLIHIISLRLSGLDVEILIYIYLNLVSKYTILNMPLSFNCWECWTIFSSYKIKFIFLKCDQLSNTILCGVGLHGMCHSKQWCVISLLRNMYCTSKISADNSCQN